jgi:hypothetical protein
MRTAQAQVAGLVDVRKPKRARGGLRRGKRDLGGFAKISFTWREIRLAAGRKADLFTPSPEL